MEKKITSTATKGLIISFIVIIIDLIGHLTNVILQDWFKWIGIIVFFAGIIWSVSSYGKEMNNNVTFGNLFTHGFKVSATVVCITFVFTIISVYLLFPDFINQIVDKAMDEARKQGKVTEEQLQQGMGMVKKITTIILFAAVVLVTLIAGTIASLIGAAVTKKNPLSPFENQP
jgi:amino acid transporter